MNSIFLQSDTSFATGLPKGTRAKTGREPLVQTVRVKINMYRSEDAKFWISKIFNNFSTAINHAAAQWYVTRTKQFDSWQGIINAYFLSSI